VAAPPGAGVSRLALSVGPVRPLVGASPSVVPHQITATVTGPDWTGTRTGPAYYCFISVTKQRLGPNDKCYDYRPISLGRQILNAYY